VQDERADADQDAGRVPGGVRGHLQQERRKLGSYGGMDLCAGHGVGDGCVHVLGIDGTLSLC
jgi:hypothetical protein